MAHTYRNGRILTPGHGIPLRILTNMPFSQGCRRAFCEEIRKNASARTAPARGGGVGAAARRLEADLHLGVELRVF